MSLKPTTKKPITSNQRLRGKSFFLTYKGHLDYDISFNHMKNTFAKYEIKDFLLSHEKAPDKDNKEIIDEKGELLLNELENGKKEYLHTHIVVRFNKNVDCKNVLRFDIDGVHGFYETQRGTWIQMLQYCIKEDKENNSNVKANFDFKKSIDDFYKSKLTTIKKKELWEEKLKNILKKQSLADCLLENCNDIKEVMGVIAIKTNCRNLDFRTYDPFENVILKGWQEELTTILSKKCDRNCRKIVWLYDDIGNNGKSFLCQYLRDKVDGVMVINCAGKSANLYNVVTEELESVQKSPVSILFDFPRALKNNKDIYEALECFKEGSYTSTKYKGGFVKFDKPHVFVFANFLPQISKLSKDRFDIREFRNIDDKVVLENIDFKRVQNLRYLNSCKVCNICANTYLLEECNCLRKSDRYNVLYKKTFGHDCNYVDLDYVEGHIFDNHNQVSCL